MKLKAFIEDLQNLLDGSPQHGELEVTVERLKLLYLNERGEYSADIVDCNLKYNTYVLRKGKLVILSESPYSG